jgi:hypothetical protein
MTKKSKRNCIAVAEEDVGLFATQSKRQKVQVPSKMKSKSAGSLAPHDITDHDHDEAVRLLRAVDWNKCQNTSRRNVIRVGDKLTPKNAMGKEYCHSFIFGRNMKDSTGQLSYWSTEYSELYAFLQKLMGNYDPGHLYTNITINKNLVCKKHTDGGNTGKSYIIAFGNFTGGRLFIEQPGGGNRKACDLFRKFVPFEGSTQPHETESFVGERYSAVFYTSSIVPSETAPRVRPPSLLAHHPALSSQAPDGTDTSASKNVDRGVPGGSGSTAGGTGTGSGSAKDPTGNGTGMGGTIAAAASAMQQKFLEMKKKLQHKSR